MEILQGWFFLERYAAGRSVPPFDAHTEHVHERWHSEAPAGHQPEPKDKAAFFNRQPWHGTSLVCKPEPGASSYLMAGERAIRMMY